MNRRDKSNYFRIFSSGRRESSSSNNAPEFKGYVPFTLKENNKIYFDFTMSNVNNITDTNNKFKIDVLGGTNYSIILLDSHQRIPEINTICTLMETGINSTTTDIYTVSYSKYTDRITITNTNTTNFSLNVEKGDLLNYIGFSIGIKSGDSSYVSDTYFDLFIDDVCIVCPEIAELIDDGNTTVQRTNNFYPLNTLDIIKYEYAEGKTVRYNRQGIKYRIKRDKEFNSIPIKFEVSDINNNLLELNNQWTITMYVEY